MIRIIVTDLSDGAQVGKSLTLKDSASSGVGLAMAAAISNGNTAEFCPNIIGIPLLGSDKSGEIHRRSCKPCLAADAPTIIRHENPVFNDTELKLANRKSNRSNHIESDIQAAKLSPPLTSLSVISPPVTADAIFDRAYLMLLTAAESHVPRLELDMFDQVMGILRKLNWSGVFSPNSNVYVQTKIKKASKYAFATFGPRSFDQFVEGKDYFVGMRDVLKYVHRQLEARHVDVKSLIESAKAFNSQIGL